jgi:hypothetical protein
MKIVPDQDEQNVAEVRAEANGKAVTAVNIA